MTSDLDTQACRLRLFDGVLASRELDQLTTLLGSRHPESGAGRPAVVSGMAGAARALVVAALAKRVPRPVVFITRSNSDLEDFQSDLEFFYSALNDGAAPGNDVLLIPSSEGDPFDGTSPHAEVLEKRALALYRIAAAPPRIVITSLRAIVQRTVSPAELAASGMTLVIGEDTLLELVVDDLIAGGYVRAEPVRAVGEFSLRGGILDVFSPAHENPHRIEFFGDTVESIREFDPDTQRSIGRVGRSVIAPMRELALTRKALVEWADHAKQRWSADRFRRDLRFRVVHADRGESFPGWEYLIPSTRRLRSSALDYFSDPVLIIDEPVEIEKTAADLYRRLEKRWYQADDAGELVLRPEELFLTGPELQAAIQSADRVEFRLIGSAAASTDEQFRIESLTLPAAPSDFKQPAERAGDQSIEQGGDQPAEEPVEVARPLQGAAPGGLFLFPIRADNPDISLISRSPAKYYGRIQALADDLTDEVVATYLFVVPSLGLAERLVHMLSDYRVTAMLLSSAGSEMELNADRIVTVGKLSNGFSLPALGLNLLVESDVFGETERPVGRRAPSRRQRSAAAFLSDLGDLKIGDYIVHIDHGIGQFRGLRQMTVAGGAPSGVFNVAEGLERGSTVREFMLLMYAEGANLYVPVERLDLVQRYSAGEGVKPKLDRLGGIGWQRTKERAKRAMRDMAEELLKLYAERKLVKGWSYGSDTPWQKEFEDAFEFQLTPDQETSIEDVKTDMEKPDPMDRLIVGDVGYGKTEVAMRAAFKAVSEGKQVAVLAPTTVLVYQHYKTFQQRFSAFPVRVEMLSRFRSAKEQKDVVKAFEAGTVDIVIGTHRLLSKDVKFKDLGLLVVDEEQRFGVVHKERIKQLRKRVDVIAMSATPIPRTLNMSLAGLRDMSVIETPPRDRLAIQTHVVQFSEAVIRSAIELELQRGGQVFFVHNRVETIYAVAELISRLAPAARVAAGHGKMTEKELESVMLRFIKHELDVLVSTTIIENGIDIPLANTIIINRADAYGLSQLYQLRGRVGRSNRRAYAYLLIPSEESLTDIAKRRLAAIREFSDLGAGFRIAALDLELRGAGNLLGSQQSGHIDSIGFDLYTQMLERTVRELKGETIEEETSTSLSLGVDIKIPEDYIYDMSQRLRAYKRISSVESDAELSDIHAEMEDRYGSLPPSIESLFQYSRLRREASALRLLSVDREGDRLTIKLGESSKIDPARLVELVSEQRDASLSPAGILKLRLESEDDSGVLAEVRLVLDKLKQQPFMLGIVKSGQDDPDAHN